MLSDRESNWSLKESIDYQRATDRPLVKEHLIHVKGTLLKADSRQRNKR